MNVEIRDPFTKFQYRKPPEHLRHVIDFFWEARFDETFPIRLLPRPGCTLIFNLGQEFFLSNNHQRFSISKHIVLPRQQVWEDLTGREHTFGIKLTTNFLVFERGRKPALGSQPLPLPVKMNRELAEPIVRAENFEARIAVANDHFEGLIEQRDPELKRYAAFFEIMNEFESGNVTDFVVKDYSAERFLTSKTMLRYFNHCVDISPKKAACMIRMRKALTSYFGHPGDFTVHQYGYYDYSHFCREVVALTGYTPGMLRNSR